MRSPASAAPQSYPWNWPEGDACGVRFVALLDPAGNYRLEAGTVS